MTSEPAFWACPRCKTPNPWASYLTVCVGCGEPRPPTHIKAAFVPRPDPPPKARTSAGRAIWAMTWLYALVVLVALGLIKGLGDRWWPATVLLFSPRWLFLAPLLVLIPWAGWRRRFAVLGVQVAAGAIVLGPMMGLHMPVGNLVRPRASGTSVRVLSLNRGTQGLDARAVTDLVASRKIDLICFQEVKADPVLDAYFAPPRWYRSKRGAIVSRFPIIEEWPDLPSDDVLPDYIGVQLDRARIRLPDGSEALIADVHMPTMNYGFKRLAAGDLAGMQKHSDWRRKQAVRVLGALAEMPAVPTIVAGDFNTPPDSPAMRLFSERYPSAFEAAGWGYGYTRPSRLRWIGIDHILATKGSRFPWCEVGPLVGSDHRPILGEVVLPGPR